MAIDAPLRCRTSFSANLLEQEREPHHEIVEIDQLRADRPLASALHVHRGARLVQSRAIGFGDGVPLSTAVSIFPYARFPGLAARLMEDGSITKALEASGLADYRRRETRILTRMPTVDEARHLKQSAGQPVLVTGAVDVDPEDRPIHLGIICFAGARVQITVGQDS